MLRLSALVLGISAALLAWLALLLGAVQLDKLGPHGQLIELGFFLETGCMILGAAICGSRPRTGAVLLLFGSFGWAVTTALAVSDNLLVPIGPLTLGTLAAILAAPRRRSRRRAAATTRPQGRRSTLQPNLIEPQFTQGSRQPVQWRRTDAPPLRYRRRKSSWVGVIGTVVVVIVGAATAFAVVMFSDTASSGHRSVTAVASEKVPSPTASDQPKLPSLAGSGTATTAGVSARASQTVAPTIQDASAIYRSGNRAGAAKIWRTQALAGDANAQFSLGTLYQNGDGVPQDAIQAAQWFQKAASQGVVGAKTALAAAYYLGSGVSQDYGLALHWFEQAAAAGDFVRAVLAWPDVSVRPGDTD